MSWLRCSSSPPKPSASITRQCSPYLLTTVLFHSHNPLVQGLIVGPTLNPFPSTSNNTLFKKKLFPVLYLPTTHITPNSLSHRLSRNSTLPLWSTNLSSLYSINGSAYSLSILLSIELFDCIYFCMYND